MKKVLFVFLLLIVLRNSHAQQRYYYSEGRKISLREDTNYLVAAVNPQAVQNKAGFIQSLASKSLTADTLFTRSQRPLVFIKKRALQVKDIKKSLLNDSNIAYLSNSLYLDTVPFVPTGEIVLKPKSTYSIADILQRLDLTDKVTISTAKTLVSIADGRDYVYEKLQVKDNDSIFDIANRIYESGLVEFAHPDYLAFAEHTARKAYVQPYASVPANDKPLAKKGFDKQGMLYRRRTPYFPNDTLSNYQWYTGVGTSAGINYYQVWEYVKNFSSIKIAIVDDGIESHEDLDAANVLTGYTPRSATSHGLPGTACNNRGMGVAGIIGAKMGNTTGIAGLQPKEKLIPINIFYDGLESTSDIANAITWAYNTAGADIINCSWTMSSSADVIKTAITNAYKYGRSGKGTSVVFAAGNNGAATLPFPANHDSVITIAAIDQYKNHFSWSNKGANVAASCETSSGLFHYTDLMAGLTRMGHRIYYPGDVSSLNYEPNLSGTSFAAPQASALAAMILEIRPNLNAHQIKQEIKNAAVYLPAASNWTDSLGWGKLDACTALKQQVQASMTVNGPATFSTSDAYFYVSGIPQSIADSVRWELIGGSFSLNHTRGANVTVHYSGTTSRYVSVSAWVKVCNDSSYAVVISQFVAGGGSSIIVAPNPGANNMSVTLKSQPDDSAASGAINKSSNKLSVLRTIKEVQAVDKMGNVVLIKKFTGEQSTENFDVSGLRSDNYLLKVFDGTRWSTQHIMVRHD